MCLQHFSCPSISHGLNCHVGEFLLVGVARDTVKGSPKSLGLKLLWSLTMTGLVKYCLIML